MTGAYVDIYRSGQRQRARTCTGCNRVPLNAHTLPREPEGRESSHMAIIVAVTVICLGVLYLCYRALPMGRGTLYGLAAVITALGGLVAALTHLL
jgi:hypothetical protein